MNVILFTQLLLFLLLLQTVISGDHLEDENVRQDENDLLNWVRNRTTTSYQPPNLKDNSIRLLLSPYKILDIDETQGTLRLNVVMRMYYRLENMNWTKNFPDAPSHILRLPSASLWMPNLAFVDSINTETSDFGQHIMSDGLVSAMFSSVIVKNSCSFDLRRFPFDTPVSSLCYTGPVSVETIKEIKLFCFLECFSKKSNHEESYITTWHFRTREHYCPHEGAFGARGRVVICPMVW